MTTKPSLETVLKAWAEKHAQPLAEQAQLAERVLSRARSALPDAPSHVPQPVRFWIRPAVMTTACAAAALILILASIVWMRPPSVPERADDNGLALELARFTDAQLDARNLVLDELDTLFNGGLRWIRIRERDFDFALAPQDPRALRVALRTVVVSRSAPDAEWIPVSSTDIMLAPDEYVSITPHASEQGHMGLWVHQLPDGQFVVDMDLALNGRNGLETQTSEILSVGQPRQIDRASAAGREYRVYQSIESLGERKG